MVIRVDISSLPSHLRHVIMNEIGFRNRSPKESTSNDSSSNRKDSSDIDENYSKNTNSNITDEVHIIDNENDTHVTKQKVKDALIKSKIDEYVAIKHHEWENKVLILRRDDAEQHGIYHCRHCGMEFDNHIKLGIHLRLHFVVA